MEIKNMFKGVSVSGIMSGAKSITDKVAKKDKADNVIDVKPEEVKAPKYSTILRAIDNAIDSMDKLIEVYGTMLAAIGEEDSKEFTYYEKEKTKCSTRMQQLQDVRDTVVLKQNFERISEQLGENSGKELLEQLAKKIMDTDK